MHVVRTRGRSLVLAAMVGLVAGILSFSLIERPELRRPAGVPQLVSVRQLPTSANVCEPGDEALPEQRSLLDRFGEASVYAGSQESGQTGVITRPPTRTIRDMDPIYSSVAVDLNFDEVVLMDNNNWALRIFNRLDNTPPGVPFTQPKRVIQGPETDIQYNNGIYIGVQHPPEVAVYRKGASGNEKPLRSLQGESTRLSDVHGVVLDQKKQLMLVTNWGHVSDAKVAGTGRFEDPSITVYPMGASGDTSPIRVIQGSRTQLNWPAQMALDPDTGDIYVANDIGHSVLVFKETDQGNAAPTRVIKGNRTGLLNPSGVF